MTPETTASLRQADRLERRSVRCAAHDPQQGWYRRKVDDLRPRRPYRSGAYRLSRSKRQQGELRGEERAGITWHPGIPQCEVDQRLLDRSHGIGRAARSGERPAVRLLHNVASVPETRGCELHDGRRLVSTRVPAAWLAPNAAGIVGVGYFRDHAFVSFDCANSSIGGIGFSLSADYNER